MLLRLGTRGSRLALAQAEQAADAIRLVHPNIGIALVPISTTGDLNRRQPFAEIGARGIFVKELEEALLAGRIDVAVHSAKDLTTTDTPETIIGAYLPRNDPRDALCGASTLKPGMRIGTASARRKALLLSLEPDLVIEPLRGNIDTRLQKRRERKLDAIVLAACGLDRLGMSSEIGRRFPTTEFLPEAGQGTIALQINSIGNELVSMVDDVSTRLRVESERACIARLGAGCSAPVAAYHDGKELTALVAAEDGSWVERRHGQDAHRVADELLSTLSR